MKSSIIKNIANIDDLAILRKIKELLAENTSERKMVQISTNTEEEIDQARKQFEKGRHISQEMVEKRLSKWQD